MRQRTLLLSILLGSLGIGASDVMGQGGPRKTSAKATVELLADTDALVPGQPINLGIHFVIDEGWHIYWKNSGDSGQPPKVTWALPDGFAAGELQFPVPHTHVAAGSIVTHIIEGEPTLLATITPPANIESERVTLSGKLRYLVCKETCLLEKADLSIELPVRRTGEGVKPAHETVFAAARRMLPKTASKYLTLAATIDPPVVKPGDKFDLRVTADIKPGYHIQSHEPLNASFIKSELFVAPTDDVYFEQPVFPAAKIRPVKVLGQVSEYEGKIEIRVPAEFDAEASAGPRTFGGVFRYQACNDKGNCFPPEAVSFSHVSGLAEAAPSTAAPTANLSEAAKPLAVATTAPGQTAALPGSAPTDDTREASENGGIPDTFGMLLLFAFIGGLILNIMPCVLPVISIKILSFVQQAGEEPARVFRLGLTFAAGILVSFEMLALTVVALKAAGQSMGWGFQFQSPGFIIAMIGIIFVFGLSLFGVFTFTLPGATVTKLSVAEEREGYLGAFLKGVLATVLATPCTAPFLGPALGVAFSSDTPQLLATFTAIGVGMSFPYVLLTAKPGWLRLLPRPGLWMEHFKQFMGFILMGTVVWLMYPLGALIGPTGLVWTLAFLAFLGLGAWLIGRQTPATPVARRLGLWTTAVLVVAAGWWNSFGRSSTLAGFMEEARRSRAGSSIYAKLIPTDGEWARGIPWRPWSPGLAECLASDGHTVYVDFTADWCLTCLANKTATLESDAVRQRMKELCVVPLKADFTQEDQVILDELQKFNRSGVPLNVIYPAGHPDDAVTLPEQLVGRSQLVLDRLAEAGSSVCEQTETTCSSAAAVTTPSTVAQMTH